jgi:hypothetical protein
MNCTQVEDLLPLYAGRDLNDGRAQSITAHLQTCARCADAAKEYGETRHLLQEFAPPAFADDVYAEIRQSVWRKIDAESNNSLTLAELFADWFRPRLVWVVATALLIMVSAIAIYFAGNGRMGRRDQNIANVPKLSSEPTEVGRGGSETLAAASSSPHSSGDQRQPGNRRYQKKLGRPGPPDRVNSLAVNSPDLLPSKIETRAQVAVPTEADVSARDTKTTLRMEIQTRNPNIRIIWFAQRDAKPVSANSKGI